MVLAWILKKWKTEEKVSLKLTEDEVVDLEVLYRSGVCVKDIAAIMYKSESRISYEVNKLERSE